MSWLDSKLRGIEAPVPEIPHGLQVNPISNNPVIFIGPRGEFKALQGRCGGLGAEMR